MNDDPLRDLAGKLRQNIDAMTQRRAEERAAASRSERVAGTITDFVGSMRFVGIHLLLYGGWIAWNLWPGLPHFDETFVVLAMAASVEAIFLSTFVLISQNRLAADADRRADLDLHINLLAEHELTRIAALVERMAQHLGVTVDDPAFEQVKRDVEPQVVLDALDASAPA
ncbi:MAG TPA: DUF1003 domain-containing protein [Sphingomonas sp.]|jgi:uncharacterized membrane protein|nr:DUF1003 domain-containing protein [Sphingomonas sp.]